MGFTQVRATKRSEPDRRVRIIDVAIEVIAEFAIAGATHGRVAQADDIPLGSMTYHFAGIDELLLEAFRKCADVLPTDFERELAKATSTVEARDAIVGLICGGVLTKPHTMTLLFELYAYMTRKDDFRHIVEVWMARSHAALEQHFPPDIARELDIFIEGTAIQTYTRKKSLSQESVKTFIAKITGDTSI